MSIRDQTPEERESGLIRIGEIYQSTDSANAEVYVQVRRSGRVYAYMFINPETLWSRILLYCTKKIRMEECER
jgi:hypothetical protein